MNWLWNPRATKRGKLFRIAILVLVSLILRADGCDTASQRELEQTRGNRNRIAETIPVPDMTFSSRRYVLAKFYKSLDNQRLRTCTMVTARGSLGAAKSDLLGIAETIGVPVNLSNQMTAPTISEPDTIYSGQNDQTVFVLRNGIGMIAESDTNAILGDCPPEVHPDTDFQRVIDYNTAKPEGSGEINFLPRVDASGRFIPDPKDASSQPAPKPTAKP